MKIKLYENNNNNVPDSNKGYYLLGAYFGTVILNSTLSIYCCWLNHVPPSNLYVDDLSLVSRNVTVFGDKAFMAVIKLK